MKPTLGEIDKRVRRLDGELPKMTPQQLAVAWRWLKLAERAIKLGNVRQE